MPRGVVVIAGGLILIAGLIGLYTGIAGGHGSRYSDADVADIVQTRPVPNAQALVAPPVSETDVRKWAREEAQGVIGHAAARKTETQSAPGDDPTSEDPNAPMTAPTLAPDASPAKPSTPGAQ